MRWRVWVAACMLLCDSHCKRVCQCWCFEPWQLNVPAWVKCLVVVTKLWVGACNRVLD